MPAKLRSTRLPSFQPSRVAACVAAAMLALVAPRVYAQARVAVVDMQRALLETDQGRIAKNALKGLFQKRQVELDQRQQALKQLRDGLERDRTHLDQDTLRTRMEDYQKQFVDLQQNFLSYQQELAEREAQLTKQIYVNLEAVIHDIGQHDSLDMVFEQGGVVWAPPNLDITTHVVQEFNRLHPASQTPTVAPLTGGAAPGPANPPPASADAGVRHAPPANPHPRGEEHPPAH